MSSDSSNKFSKYEVPYIAPLIFHVVTLINIINITIIIQKILRFIIRNRCIVGVAILVRKTCGYKTNELNIENDRICAVKLVKRGYENVCIISVLLPSTNYSAKYEVPYIAPLIFHVVTLINIINITIIIQKILRFIIRNRCIVVAFNNYFGEHNLARSSTCNSSKGSAGVAILVRKTCGYKTNELNIENDRICAVKLVKRGYENVCIISVNQE
jgi:hypothetical protein